MSASDPLLPAPCPRPRPARQPASPYENMTREELVDRLWIVEDQNHLLRLLNTTSMKLLAVLRERGTVDSLWEKSELEVGRNGASGVEEEREENKNKNEEEENKDEQEEEEQEEQEEEEEEETMKGGDKEDNRAHRIAQQLLEALRKELKPWPGTTVVLFFFLISKIIDFLVGLLTNYVFAQIMGE